MNKQKNPKQPIPTAKEMIEWGQENGYLQEEEGEEFKDQIGYLLIMGTIILGGHLRKITNWLRRSDIYPTDEQIVEMAKQWRRLKDNKVIIGQMFQCEDEETLGVEIIIAQTIALGYIKKVGHEKDVEEETNDE